MEWTYAKPDADVPVHYQKLLGLWTGFVSFAGSSESTRMCIAVAIQAVSADGTATAQFAWNLGDGIESPNQVSKGVSQWQARNLVLLPEKGEQLVFASIAPYRGKWYRYMLDLPTAAEPNTIRGYLYGTQHGSATDLSVGAWKDFVEAHRVTLRRQGDSSVPFPIPIN
ncbi:MAG: hypothetical protein ACM3II_10350 [Rhodospirillaceae bacterium]